METNSQYRDQLRQITAAMARIHKTLLENEIESREVNMNMVMSPADRLNALLNDPELEWLRSLSQLMASIDEVYFQKEPITVEQMNLAKKRIHELLIEPGETNFARKYRSQIPVVPDLMVHHGLLRVALGK